MAVVAPWATRPSGTNPRLMPTGAPIRWGLRLLLLLIILVGWQLAVSAAGLGNLVLPPPVQAIRDAISQLAGAHFWTMAGTTALLAAIASLAGVILGGVGGVLLWHLKQAGRGPEQLLIAFYATPTIVFYPILLVLLGLNNWPVIVIGIPLAAIPTTLGVLHALRAIAPKLNRLSQSLSLHGIRKYRMVILPAVIPAALPEVRVGVMFCILGMIAVQFVDGSSGLGYGISQAYQRFDEAGMWGLVIDTVVGMLLLNGALTRFLGRSAEFNRSSQEDRATKKDILVRSISLLFTIAMGLGAWDLLSTTTPTVSSPIQAMSGLAKIASGPLGPAVSSTLVAVLLGFLIAVVVGITVGYIIGQSTALRTAYMDALAASFTVPTVIIYPLFLGIFGVGETAKIVIAAISAFIPVAMVTSASVASVDKVLTRVSASLHCTKLQAARKIIIPSVLPHILAGVRIGLGVSLISVVVSEMFTSNQGLGILVLTLYNQQNYPAMYGVITLIIAVALVGTGLVALFQSAVERRYA